MVPLILGNPHMTPCGKDQQRTMLKYVSELQVGAVCLSAQKLALHDKGIRVHIGVMEKKMETTIMGLYRDYIGMI